MHLPVTGRSAASMGLGDFLDFGVIWNAHRAKDYVPSEWPSHNKPPGDPAASTAASPRRPSITRNICRFAGSFSKRGSFAVSVIWASIRSYSKVKLTLSADTPLPIAEIRANALAMTDSPYSISSNRVTFPLEVATMTNLTRRLERIESERPAVARSLNKWKRMAIARLGAVILLVLFATGCKDAPGADGRYAHGYGYLYRAGDGRWAP
jgi:hypothetical protein